MCPFQTSNPTACGCGLYILIGDAKETCACHGLSLTPAGCRIPHPHPHHPSIHLSPSPFLPSSSPPPTHPQFPYIPVLPVSLLELLNAPGIFMYGICTAEVQFEEELDGVRGEGRGRGGEGRRDVGGRQRRGRRWMGNEGSLKHTSKDTRQEVSGRDEMRWAIVVRFEHVHTRNHLRYGARSNEAGWLISMP